MKGKSNKFRMVIAGFLVVVGIALTLFRHWEFTGESWGYWYFARVFAETGKFIVIDRSPIYILYLNLFRWMGYPSSFVIEYIATSVILAISLIIFFRRYTGLIWAAFAVFLWIPFFQVAEPPVQKLALACSCLAIMVRDMKFSRFRLAISYALLVCAYLFRSTYIILIFIFAVWDTMRIFKQKNLKAFLVTIRPKLHDWPILFMLILLAWFNLMQSPHPWNGPAIGSSTWYPNKNKVMVDSTFLHTYNWQYILHRYGTCKDKDFYFTNKEVFDGADTMMGAIRANPRFVAIQTVRNIKWLFGVIVNFTMLPRVVYRKICLVLFIPIIFYGAFRACKTKAMSLFIIANIFLVGVTILSSPKARYSYPLIPVLILSAGWYGKQIRNILLRLQGLSRAGQRLSLTVGKLAIPFVLIFFSNGLPAWVGIAKDIVQDMKQGEIKILEARPYSMKASFKSLNQLVRNCHGVIPLECTFVGAFMDIPLSKVYDTMEIPPFGHYGNSDYDGLRPNRIDCVLVSHELATGIGYATNYQIRYDNYILPYAKQLQKMGATVHNIEKFGQVITLPKEGLKKGIRHNG